MHSIHKPVLLHEVTKYLTEATRTRTSETATGETPWYVDGTLGGAGHALAIAKSLEGEVNILGLDRDPAAIERAESILKDQAQRLILEKDNLRNIGAVMGKHGIATADMILYDLGLSSDEIEASGKGFSFQNDEPLYMTMGDPQKDHAFTAMDIVNGWKEEDIANVIFGYGEDRFARRIAKALVQYRDKKKMETSAELAEIVKGAMPRYTLTGKKSKIHPATKTFQALRIAVNDELGSLKDGLVAGYDKLGKGGRMAVISFHSLEDRIVKNFYKQKEKSDGAVISKKPITATDQEIAENPRSRSAKLRCIQKV